MWLVVVLKSTTWLSDGVGGNQHEMVKVVDFSNRCKGNTLKN